MNKYVYIIIGISILIGVSLYIGNSMGKKEQRNTQIKKEIEYIQVENKESENKIDSLNSVIKKLNSKDLKLKKQETIVIKKADKIGLLNTVISIKDSIETNLNKTIGEKDNIINLKNDIISNKDEEIRLTKQLSKPRTKKIVVGLQLGTGGALTKRDNNLNIQFNLDYKYSAFSSS